MDENIKKDGETTVTITNSTSREVKVSSGTTDGQAYINIEIVE